MYGCYCYECLRTLQNALGHFITHGRAEVSGYMRGGRPVLHEEIGAPAGLTRRDYLPRLLGKRAAVARDQRQAAGVAT